MADRDAVIPMHEGPAADDPLWRSKWPMNDAGNAQRFHVAAAGRLLFCAELGRAGDWLWFDGRRWTMHDGAGRARAAAMAVPALLMGEARALRDASDGDLRAVYGPKYDRAMADEKAAALAAWAIKTGNSDRTSGMIKQAASLTDGDGEFVMRARLDEFDTDPLAYHCANGVIRFRQVDGATGAYWTVDFRPGHAPSDRIMQIAAVDYRPDAPSPAWNVRMAELHDDAVARVAIQRIYGMTLTGLTSDQAFYIFQGKGGDGKSMTNAIIAAMHGDYFKAASPKTFLQAKHDRGGSDHQADIVRLRGDVRMVVIDEPKRGSTWDGERIKQVTGSKITARAPNAVEDVTFAPRWKLIAECNTLPNAPSDDRGFRRRFKLLPWLKSYGVTAGLTEELPHIVEARLRAELSGILNWCIEGALEWLATGDIPQPEVAVMATSSFWATGSAIADWFEERADLSDPAAECGATALYEDFRAFCLGRGDKEDAIMKQTSFGKALNERQIYVGRDRAGRKVRIGLKLRAGDVGATGWRDGDLDRMAGGEDQN